MQQPSYEDLPLIADNYGPDPYAYFREVRDASPIARGAFGQFYLMRYRDFDLITSEKTRQFENELLVAQGITSGPIFEARKNGLLASNGDAHRRRRTPLARSFAFKLMDGMRPRIREVMSSMVQPLLDHGPVDFLNKIAVPLPALIIAEILGVPEEDLPVFLTYVPGVVEALGPIAPDRREGIEKTITEFHAYVDQLIAPRRVTPRGDFLSDLILQAGDAGLSEIELRMQITALIVAGSDTTRGSLCMTLSTLLKHPDQWREFCADPDGLKRDVVQEGLRFEPVINGVPRVTNEEIEVSGIVVPKDRMLVFSALSALRDPEVYADPDSFNIHRTDHPRWHPVFGAGAHRCLGEALARAQLEEALAVIAKLAPNTELLGTPPRLSDLGLRQVDQMRVSFK